MAERKCEHANISEVRTPVVQRISVNEATFNRGNGCCAKSPVRIVTAYYSIDTGKLLFEDDPIVTGNPEPAVY
jgi:hypothetical protein